MKSPRRASRVLALPVIASAAFGLACSELDQTRVRAHLGDRSSQVILGHAYEMGEDVPQDLEAAARWFRRAAEQRQPHGCARLGNLYALGAGVPRDLVQAHTFFELGFRYGLYSLGPYLKQLEFSLTTEQIAASLERADEWQASH